MCLRKLTCRNYTQAICVWGKHFGIGVVFAISDTGSFCLVFLLNDLLMKSFGIKDYCSKKFISNQIKMKF